MNTFFSIITPTYQRPKLLNRAIGSLIAQSYTYWEMIIVNDDPDTKVADDLLDSRVHIFNNEHNLGANSSRNQALSLVSPHSDRVIFLDDDDYLAPDALSTLAHLVENNPQTGWLMTNRITVDKNVLTHAPASNQQYEYTQDYLVGRRLTGDATHCLDTKLATIVKFPISIKNGEEWLYFFEISRYVSLFYIDENITMTDGYSATGLNFRSRSTITQLQTLKYFIYEGYKRDLLWYNTFWIYIFMRLIRAFLKHT